MVETTHVGDGINRNIIYATWRQDKPAEKGYSKELIAAKLDPKYYEDLESLPPFKPNCKTFLDYFELNAREHRNQPYLGTRIQLNEKEFGDYEWKTFGQVEQLCQNLARGMQKLSLITETEGEGKKWKFVGIWSKNRYEWLATHIANMYYNNTTIGFFDSMGLQSVDYIINQTELSCIFSTPDYISKIIQMKKENLAATIKNLVCFDDFNDSQREQCLAVGIKLFRFKDVLEAGSKEDKENPSLPWNKCTENDFPIFSYTSGTTGDSKGVKLTHKNILSSAQCVIPFVTLTPEDAIISYLPYPHSFEQVLTFYGAIVGSKIGYYQGDPLKLTEDCALLRPALFPSVPRLYSRIYAKIKDRLNGLTGIAGWIARRGVGVKMTQLRQNGVVTNGCYDKLVFKKIKALLGGNVRAMITGSAPIEPDVMEFLKICFCCPFLEGYGLTETSGGSSVSQPNDPVVGHVGGPLPCVKWRLQDVPEMNYFSSDKPYPRGELQMKGATVFSGYYMRPDKTSEAFDKDGWFKTGDIVMVYPNGSTKIIDRSKNIFKLSQGEYIAPEKIENVFGLSPLIAQSLLYGDSLRSCCVAIIVPQIDQLKKWSQENCKDEMDVQKVLINPLFKNFMMEEITSICKQHKLTSLEKPKEIYLTLDQFSIENNLLTPTFKLKRNVARDYYKNEIDNMYQMLIQQGF